LKGKEREKRDTQQDKTREEEEPHPPTTVSHPSSSSFLLLVRDNNNANQSSMRVYMSITRWFLSAKLSEDTTTSTFHSFICHTFKTAFAAAFTPVHPK
jgi:hypothetical protein